ncbi:RNA-binding domain-containing protein [Panus rudis PR-1116 ss-1]|nr:RNA-binding domain-containing protein [Panus rudis PR-1116 ss-1]
MAERDSASPKGAPSTPPTHTETHLSYPAPAPVPEPVVKPQPGPRQLLKDRLYIGNLHPSVDEYTLLQVFSKYGKISKLDFLFHKSGPLKGKPRGYAFVEYSNSDDAAQALVSANDKLLRGRKLVVTYAHQAPPDDASAHGGAMRMKKGISEVGKPTTLSLLKSVGSGRSNAGTEDKIAKMEAKLRQLEQSDIVPVPAHPSLPPKPAPALTLPDVSSSLSSAGHAHRPSPSHGPAGEKSLFAKAKASKPLPSFPTLQSQLSLKKAAAASSPTSNSMSSLASRAARKNASGLAGVKIVKKEKDR